MAGGLTEEWRAIPSAPGYEASSLGRIRRSVPGRGRTYVGKILAQHVGRAGYLFVSPVINGRNRSRQVHDLVAEAFLGPRPASREVNHIDADRQNPAPANLEYVTRRENAQHASLLGRLGRDPDRVARGEKVASSKLDAAAVTAIRGRLAKGERQCDLAERFQISRSQMSNIANYRQWRHVS